MSSDKPNNTSTNTPDEEGIILSCIDGSVFMPMNIVNESSVLKNMITDCGDINNTPVMFNSADMTAFINLCRFVKHEGVEENEYSDQISHESHQFLYSLEKDDVPEDRRLDTIGKLICISDFLDNNFITDLCAKYIAHRLSKLCNFENKTTFKKSTIDLLDSEFVSTSEQIKSKEPAEICNISGLEMLRKILQVKNDLTDAEIKKIQATNMWCSTSK